MKYVGIITAMIEELEAVKKLMDKDIKMKTVNGIEVIMGKIKGIDCILVQCNAGKVNAARVTQILIDSFEIEYMINVGVAGALNYKVKVGDVIIGEKVVQHDFDITAFGHNKGYISEIGDYIKCSEELNMKIEEIIKRNSEKQYKVKLGIIATGDIFCTDISMKNKIREKFNADVVDMECGAIAQVTYLNKLPFIVIRSISDSPNGKNAKTFEENLSFACERFGNLLTKLLDV